MLTRTLLRTRTKARPSQPWLAVRTYAQPVGSGTSVDARLGMAAPPAPQPMDPDSPQAQHPTTFTVNPRPGNPNDLSELLKAPSSSSSASSSSKSDLAAGRKATLASVKGTAIAAAQRRAATGVPTDNLPLMPGEQPASHSGDEPNPVDANHTIDREHPHSIDALSGRNELDERVLQAARAAHAIGSGAGLRQLVNSLDQEAGKILPIELPYESAPSQARKVSIPQRSSATNTPPEMADDDGVLLLAYVDDVTAPRGKENISVCTGFAVEGGQQLADFNQDEASGHLVISVAHTLRGALSSKASSSPSATGTDRSAAIAITRGGDVYPVQTLLSSLPSSDLVLLKIAKEPLPVAQEGSHAATHATSVKSIKTLPISPYPSATNSHLLVSSFWGFEDDSSCSLPPFSFSSAESQPPRLTVQRNNVPSSPEGRDAETVRKEGDAMSQSRWGEVRLVEYKDAAGSEARQGTYDSLETMEYKLVQDSPINPKVLRGDELTFVPGVGASAVNANAHAGGSSSSSNNSHPSTPTLSGSSSSRGFGGYGVPNFPPPGSSGGPIVDCETGAVVGVTRGCKMSSLGGRRGEGIPSEKICEFFSLPGMGPKKKGHSNNKSSTPSAQVSATASSFSPTK